MSSATQVLDELIAELGTGPCERVVGEYVGSVVWTKTPSEEKRAFHAAVDSAIHELRESWGPTADPHWVDDLLPGRKFGDSETEYDGLFALFHRPGMWGYVRVRKTEIDEHENAHLRFILGVVKDQT